MEATPGPPPPRADLLTAQGTHRARPEPARSSCRPHRARDWAVWKWALWIPCLGVRGREEQNWIQPSHGGCCPCACAHVCAQCARGQVGCSTSMHQTQVPHFCAKCLPWSLRTSFPDALARPSECPASAGPGAFAAAAGVSVSPSAGIQPRGAGVQAAPGAVLSCSVPTGVAEAAGQAPSACRAQRGQVPDLSRAGVGKGPGGVPAGGASATPFGARASTLRRAVRVPIRQLPLRSTRELPGFLGAGACVSCVCRPEQGKAARRLRRVLGDTGERRPSALAFAAPDGPSVGSWGGPAVDSQGSCPTRGGQGP